jgi:replicative DNA helicase
VTRLALMPPEPEDERPDLEAERAGVLDRAARELTTDRTKEPRFSWPDVDAMVGPLLPGMTWFVLARPSNGKTTFAHNVIADPLLRAHGIVYFGTEEAAEIAMLRYAALRAGVDPADAADGKLSEADNRTVARTLRIIRDERVFFCEDASPSVPVLRRACQAAVERQMRFVVVDHAHRMSLPDGTRETLERSIRALVKLGVEFGVTLLVMAQARRARTRMERYQLPDMSDALGSSAFEQEAHGMLGLYRPLARSLTRAEVQDFEAGTIAERDVLMADTMGVGVLKHRRRGHLVGNRAYLHCEMGKLTSHSWRPS